MNDKKIENEEKCKHEWELLAKSAEGIIKKCTLCGKIKRIPRW